MPRPRSEVEKYDLIEQKRASLEPHGWTIRMRFRPYDRRYVWSAYRDGVLQYQHHDKEQVVDWLDFQENRERLNG